MNKENEKWDALVKYISLQFGDGEILDLQAILFLIGINELGQGAVFNTAFDFISPKGNMLSMIHVIEICILKILFLNFHTYF